MADDDETGGPASPHSASGVPAAIAVASGGLAYATEHRLRAKRRT